MRKIILLWVLLTFFAFLFSSAFAAQQIVFSENFENADSITANKGTLTGTYSFEQGISANAIRLSKDSMLDFNIGNIDLHNGSLEFYFKPNIGLNVPPEFGLAELDANRYYDQDYKEKFIIFFNRFVWSEFEVGGVNQQRSILDASLGKWNHIALTWRCQKGAHCLHQIYLNGIAGTPRSTSEVPIYDFELNKELILKVGRDWYYGKSNASFDELQLYNYVISSKKISESVSKLKNLSEANNISLLEPQDGARISFQTRFAWTGQAGQKFAIMVSPDINFEKDIVTATYWDYMQRARIGSGWAKIANILKKYPENTQLYWKIVSDKKVSSETRSFSLDKTGELPKITTPKNDDDFNMQKGYYGDYESDSIEWTNGDYYSFELQFSTRSDFPIAETIKTQETIFCTEPTALNFSYSSISCEGGWDPNDWRQGNGIWEQTNWWTTDILASYGKEAQSIISLAKKTSDMRLYVRVAGTNFMGNTEYSEPIVVKVNLIPPIPPSIDCPKETVGQDYAFKWSEGYFANGTKYLQIGYDKNFAKKTYFQVKIIPYLTVPVKKFYKNMVKYSEKTADGALYTRIYTKDKYNGVGYSNICEFKIQ